MVLLALKEARFAIHSIVMQEDSGCKGRMPVNGAGKMVPRDRKAINSKMKHSDNPCLALTA